MHSANNALPLTALRAMQVQRCKQRERRTVKKSGALKINQQTKWEIEKIIETVAAAPVPGKSSPPPLS